MINREWPWIHFEPLDRMGVLTCRRCGKQDFFVLPTTVLVNLDEVLEINRFTEIHNLCGVGS